MRILLKQNKVHSGKGIPGAVQGKLRAETPRDK
jgi:hypothetical protein